MIFRVNDGCKIPSYKISRDIARIDTTSRVTFPPLLNRLDIHENNHWSHPMGFVPLFKPASLRMPGDTSIMSSFEVVHRQRMYEDQGVSRIELDN